MKLRQAVEDLQRRMAAMEAEAERLRAWRTQAVALIGDLVSYPGDGYTTEQARLFLIQTREHHGESHST